MIELVFSFVLNTWGGLGMVHSWADTHLGGAHMLTERMSTEREILCALEMRGDLVYDGRWREKTRLPVPPKCLPDKEGKEKVLSQISFRSLTLASVPNLSSWDQQIDIRLKDQTPFTIYLRQDKHHIGVHSTAGWAMWVERKKGSVRFEMADTKSRRHFRLKARGNVNPLKGEWESVQYIEALHVYQDKGLVQKAHILVSNEAEGFTEINFEREKEGLKRVTKGEAKKTPARSFADSWAFKVGEKELTAFSDVSSQKYQDFIQRGRPLAFHSVDPEQTVPETALFR